MGESYDIGISGTGTYYQSYYVPSNRRHSSLDYSTAYFNPKEENIVAVRDDYLDLYNSSLFSTSSFKNPILIIKFASKSFTIPKSPKESPKRITLFL